MKSRLFLLALLVCILVSILAQVVFAVQIVYDDLGNIQSGPTNVVQVAIALMGGPSQDRIANVDSEVSFKNIGSQTINISDIDAAVASQFGFEVRDFSGSTVFAPGETKSFKIRGDIPLDFDSIDDQGNTGAKKIGTVTYLGTVGNESLVVSTPLFLEAVNQLELKTLRVFINDRLETVEEDESLSGISPGDIIKVEAEVRNNFVSENEAGEGEGTTRDITIQDISFELVIDHESLDLDEDVDIGDLRPEQEQREQIEFTIPNDLDTSTLFVRVTIEGQDENGAEHGLVREFILAVEQQRHDLSFQDIKVLPNQQVTCGQEITFQFTLANIGRQDEEKGKLSLISSGLDIDINQNVILREGKTEEMKIPVLIPVDAREGTYIFNLKSFYDEQYQVDQKNVDIEIKNCNGQGTIGTPEGQEEQLPPPRVVTVTPESVSETVTPEDEMTEDQEGDKTWLWWIVLALGILIIIVAVIIFLVWKFAY
ncbi:hypothetical protein J4410_02470 [Candidatus Woesearchaeota archaeon]|nr:hypothetical protein [Candidatus Woesearchaeota archaeon]